MGKNGIYHSSALLFPREGFAEGLAVMCSKGPFVSSEETKLATTPILQPQFSAPPLPSNPFEFHLWSATSTCVVECVCVCVCGRSYRSKREVKVKVPAVVAWLCMWSRVRAYDVSRGGDGWMSFLFSTSYFF